ncbi:hypothetical protein OH784_11600 [Ectobacillus funiculus]|uniref:hypothetical protein n=1 Tax=Ectobacillus funiculus TaxID=137993 RepID=UPI00397B1C28
MMSKEVRNAPKMYTRPMVLSSQSIRFETAHSWNPGTGNQINPGGNLGEKFPSSNPNPTPGGAGAPGKGKNK